MDMLNNNSYTNGMSLNGGRGVFSMETKLKSNTNEIEGNQTPMR
jgi:hypothetical protein